MVSTPIEYAVYRCPFCGAPVPPPSEVGEIRRCSYCLEELRAEPKAYRRVREDEEPLADPHLQRLWIGGARYAVLGRMAEGESSDVFLARRDQRPTELVVLKCLRAPSDVDLLEREQAVLGAMLKSQVEGAAHFRRLLPQPIAKGTARLGLQGDQGERVVSVLGFRSGFVHTFEDVRRAYPEGVAPQAAVWLWKRTLELLDFVHRSGFVHGAVHPAHLLVHARDHGVVLVGYSCAGDIESRLPAILDSARGFYPSSVLKSGRANAASDIAMSARCLKLVLGSDPEGPLADSLPKPLSELIERSAEPSTHDAWALRDELDSVARGLFGPPRYVPFSMPGWTS